MVAFKIMMKYHFFLAQDVTMPTSLSASNHFFITLLLIKNLLHSSLTAYLNPQSFSRTFKIRYILGKPAVKSFLHFFISSSELSIFESRYKGYFPINKPFENENGRFRRR